MTRLIYTTCATALNRSLRIAARLAPAALLWLFFPESAAADNCSSYSDCYGAARMAQTAGVGAAVLSLVWSLLPGAGEVKGIYELFSGEDVVTKEKIPLGWRIVGAIPVVGRLGKLARGGRALTRLASGARTVDRVTDAARTADRAADVARTADRAADVGRAARTADRVADAGRAATTADRAADAGRAAGAVDRAADAGRAAGAADRANDLRRGGTWQALSPPRTNVPPPARPPIPAPARRPPRPPAQSGVRMPGRLPAPPRPAPRPPGRPPRTQVQRGAGPSVRPGPSPRIRTTAERLREMRRADGYVPGSIPLPRPLAGRGVRQQRYTENCAAACVEALANNAGKQLPSQHVMREFAKSRGMFNSGSGMTQSQVSNLLRAAGATSNATEAMSGVNGVQRLNNALNNGHQVIARLSHGGQSGHAVVVEKVVNGMVSYADPHSGRSFATTAAEFGRLLTHGWAAKF